MKAVGPLELNTHYFEEMQMVAPTDYFVEENLGFAPIATLNTDHHYSSSALVILPIEPVPVQEIIQTALRDYTCHNSYRLPR